MLSEEISMVYVPLAVPAGTVKVAFPELAIPARDKSSVLSNSGMRRQLMGVRTSEHGSLVQVARGAVAQCQGYGPPSRGSPGEGG